MSLCSSRKFKAGSKIELGRGQKVSDTTSASPCIVGKEGGTLDSFEKHSTRGDEECGAV